ncbi:indole-3-glycerol phosphate synthase TrpC [Cardiobacteriaceae bacterium TAE3-ERU3]|nr:indole-3-glycerol phosphate synthase TrpC [Cardiobacteriaceae bacterium TAE3-ERU3]
MNNILQEIVAHKRTEVAARQKQHLMRSQIDAISQFNDLPRGFIQVLQQKVVNKEPAVIAEVKRASPSQGIIAHDFDPVCAAQSYATHGATCLSVLTDEQYFQGHDEYLRQVRAAVDLPVLRKEFIVDEYQIAESRLLGADAILLIVAVLDDVVLRDFTLMAHDLGMDVLVEVHDEHEFERALKLPVGAIGVNNRDLRDFSVNLQTSIDLVGRLPEGQFLISESGIATRQDIELLQDAGIYSYLIGGSLMVHAEPGQALAKLLKGE